MSDYFFPREQEDGSQVNPLGKIMLSGAWLLAPGGALARPHMLCVTRTPEQLVEK